MFSTGNSINFDEIIKKMKENGEKGGFENESGVEFFINDNLDSEKAAALRAVLSDEGRVKAILESDAAKALFKKLSGGDGK